MMDLSRLTRPAVLCQCSRCSSSLAALENDWAKLSNSYSTTVGWLSVELHRISVSSEKKQVPQSSDLSILRGRILQEISCKLCQQKLGVICALDNGPNVFWKLSKVSFREIVTMRTVEPTFKDGSLERLLNATTPKESARRDRNSIQPGALVRAGPNEIDTYNPSVEQQIQHQGLSIDHISSSVSNLHDTMSELKSAFTALRIELNGPGRSPDMGNVMGSDFSMITTCLREIKAKSDEIERLKLEIEAMKLRNRYVGEQELRVPTLEEPLPQVQSPGLLQGSRKRPLPDSFQSGRTHPIADSFDNDDDDDSIGDFSLSESIAPPVKIPLKAPELYPTTNMPNEQLSESPSIRIEVSPSTHQSEHAPRNDTINNTQQQTVSKRPRLSHATERPQSSGNHDKKRGVGRPRKSFGPTTDISQTPKPTPLSEQNGNASVGSDKGPLPLDTTPSEPSSAKENRPSRSRSLRSRSRPPGNRSTMGGDDNPLDKNQVQTPGNNKEHLQAQGGLPLFSKEDPLGHTTNSGKRGTHITPNGVHAGAEDTNEANEKRKAQVASRDLMARLAMQREEAMETEEVR